MKDRDDLLPPHDREAERSVLGCILNDNRAYHDAAAILRGPAAFYVFGHGCIYAGLAELIDAGKPADLVTLTDWLKAKNNLEDAGGIGYVVDLIDAAPSAANLTRYAEIIRDHATLRELIHACSEIQREAMARVLPAEQMLEEAEKRILGISRFGVSGQYQHISAVNREALERLERKATGQATEISTGLRDVDNYTGGLHRGELVILAARPSVGKTALSLFFTYKAAGAGVPVLFVSLEQAPVELAERLWCIQSGLDSNKLRKGTIRVNSDDGLRLLDASNHLDGLPVFIDGESRDVGAIVANCRRAKAKEKIGLVVIDYLQLIDAHAPGQSVANILAGITRRLKHLARELSVPVVLLSQFNRDSEKEKRRPRLSDLRDSGAIEQDCDTALLLHRPTEDDEHSPTGLLQVIIAKQRNGARGDVTILHEKANYRFNNFAGV